MLTSSAKKSRDDRLFTSASTAVRSASRTNDSSRIPDSSGLTATSLATASRAFSRADLATAAFRSPNALFSLDCMAEKMMANPSTRLMSSSSLSCSSWAASSSSLAMLKETDTDRSEPMDESVPNVVPPTPPVTCVPPGVVGAPLITTISSSLEVGREEALRAASNRVQALGAFFGYQREAAVYFRRLVLTLPSATSGKRSREYAKPRDGVSSCGSAFGTTLGSLCAYLEGRGVPAEKAHILRSVRTQLLPIAEALQTMRGADAEYLARGLASCRVAQVQRAGMHEPMTKMDHKYGNPYTCIGATAALITCMGVMSAVQDHATHLGRDNSLGKALRCALVNLENWKASRIAMSDDAWLALAAERRALQRASAGARRAAHVAQDLPAHELLARQLEWARIAAFPPNTLVNEFSQPSILSDIEIQTLFRSARAAAQAGAGAPIVSETVPLSQIPLGRLLAKEKRKGAGDGDSSVGSSWATMSSHASSAHSCVSSGASLDGDLVVEFSGMGK